MPNECLLFQAGCNHLFHRMLFITCRCIQTKIHLIRILTLPENAHLLSSKLFPLSLFFLEVISPSNTIYSESYKSIFPLEFKLLNRNDRFPHWLLNIVRMLTSFISFTKIRNVSQ